MLGSEAIVLMKQRLTRSTAASTALDTWIENEFKAAQIRIEGNLTIIPWFLLEERSYSSVTAGEERVSLPSDFLRENDDDDMQIFDTAEGNWSEMRKSTMDAMRVRFPDELEGRPQWYDYAGTYFRVRPIPDLTTYRLYMTYYKQDIVFATGSENEWLKYYPDLLIAEAGIPVAIGIRNDAALTLFREMRAAELSRLTIDTEAREQANADPNPVD